MSLQDTYEFNHLLSSFLFIYEVLFKSSYVYYSISIHEKYIFYNLNIKPKTTLSETFRVLINHIFKLEDSIKFY